MSTASQRYTDADYLACDWFSSAKGDDTARMVRTRVVTTRKAQHCSGNGQGEGHTVPPGSRALNESAIIDGAWGSYYLCAEHMDAWLDTVNGMDDESIDAGGSK